MFTTINNDDTKYLTLLDNRELIQVEYPLKHNNNKTINIQTSHEITNYIHKIKKNDETNAILSINTS